MDHDLYDWSMLADRTPVTWPGDKTTSYPDLRHYTLRDYGNRVGVFRLFKALDRFGVTASVAMNTRLAERVPYLLNRVVERGHELLCHGWDMDSLHYGGIDESTERDLVRRSLAG